MFATDSANLRETDVIDSERCSMSTCQVRSQGPKYNPSACRHHLTRNRRRYATPARRLARVIRRAARLAQVDGAFAIVDVGGGNAVHTARLSPRRRRAALSPHGHAGTATRMSLSRGRRNRNAPSRLDSRRHKCTHKSIRTTRRCHSTLHFIAPFERQRLRSATYCRDAHPIAVFVSPELANELFSR